MANALLARTGWSRGHENPLESSLGATSRTTRVLAVIGAIHRAGAGALHMAVGTLRQVACVARERRTQWRSAFTSPTDALPVDLFRILIGLIGAAYFSRLAVEAARLYGPDGLLDPATTRDLFWYARWTLLHPDLPGIGVSFFRVLYLASAGASLCVAAGIGTRPLSAGLFIVAASTFRWNIPAVYLDDALMQLMLLWVFLLPTGNTLTIRELRTGGPGILRRWADVQVPGAAVRCFLVNLALIYGVAGAWKWTSPLWKQGLALYAGLKMAVAHDPDRWQPRHLPILRAGNYGALLLESIVPLAIALPAFHRLKLACGAGLVAFHLGIVATLKIPFANLACIAALAVVFRKEIMTWVRRGAPPRPAYDGNDRLDLRARAAVALVVTIGMSMLVDALRPRWRSGTHDSVRNSTAAGRAALRAGHNPFAAVLWVVGIAQSYRLFDWIDERNYYITYEVVERAGDGRQRLWDSRKVFPRSQRDVLFQSYLHDVMWFKVPRHRLHELQNVIFERYARQFCRKHPDTGAMSISRSVQRVHAANLDLTNPVREPFLSFSCHCGAPAIRFVRLSTA